MPVKCKGSCREKPDGSVLVEARYQYVASERQRGEQKQERIRIEDHAAEVLGEDLAVSSASMNLAAAADL
jgi:hypothetical protein